MATLSCVRHHLRRQFGVVTLGQLYEAGLSREAVRHLVRHRHLKRFHRGVYVACDWPFSVQQVAYAGVAASPPGAALARFSASAHLALLTAWPAQPQVLVPGNTGARGPKLVNLSHSTTLLPKDTFTYKGIRTTTPARTLDDIAPRTDQPTLRRALRRAEFEHRLDLTTLTPRSTQLRDLVALYAPIDLSESELEALFVDLCARHGIPRPECQLHVGPYRADFVWHDVGLIIETDGRRAHEGWAARQEDLIKERFLRAQTGYELERFTYAEIVHRGAETAAELRALRLRASRRRPVRGR